MRNITRSLALISCLAACGGDNNSGDCQEGQTLHDGRCFGLEDNGKPYVAMPDGQAPPPDARDRDGDGWLECTVWLDGFCDCNDADAAFNPRRFEDCSGTLDYDCDGFAGPLDGNEPATWVLDLDGDGYGKRIPLEYEVDTASNYDTDPATNSWTLTGEGYESGCDGRVGMAGILSALFDGDLKAADMPLVQINIGPNGEPIDEDCHDRLSSVHPGAFESCNALDDNCNGQIDEGPPADAGAVYADLDGDGFGAGEGGAFCPADVPPGWVPTDTDCNDDPVTGVNVHPGAIELPADGVDQNCDGVELCYVDNDGDGVGTGQTALGSMNCDGDGEAMVTGDCDDDDAALSPLVIETCNGYDDDCDGLVDDQDAVPAPTVWYLDLDMDGYGDSGASTSSCTQPSGSVADWTDCNDGDWAINPGAAEVCDALDVDENCDGLADDLDSGATGKTTWYRDGDRDGYGSTTVVRAACEAPTFTSATSDDCDDFAAGVNPGAIEVPHDGVDQNCNGGVDDICLHDELRINFYPAIGFGSPSIRTMVRQVTDAVGDYEPYVDWTTTTPDGVWIQTGTLGDTSVIASQCTAGLTQLNVRFMDEYGNIHCSQGGHQVFADLNGVMLSVGVGVDDFDLACTEVIPLAP
jgi:hypothetical protein